MSIAAAPYGGARFARSPAGLPARSLGNGALWLAAFLSGFVIEEPAPYELYMALVTVVWLACGLKLRREFGPLIICLMLYIAGGMASIPMAREMGEAMMYIAISGFLAVTAIFYAAVLADDPDRFRIIQSGYTISAVLVAAIGIAGYFQLFPGAGYFTLYDRARGTFQDPNVFGPFLVLPTVLLLQRLLKDSVLKNLHLLVPLAILLLGVFLSFSRGAWGLLVAAVLTVYILALITEQKRQRRARLIFLGAAGILAVAALIAAALSIDSVAEMFSQRARLVQEYDGARLGRFARYSLGFQMVMEHPLGIGAMEFNKYFPEDEHNVYLKGFTTYGWLGGTIYILLALWTLIAMVPLLFKARPWTAFTQSIFAVFAGHLILSVFIDTDHWRHMYMLYGLAWGMIATDKMERRQQRKQLSSRRAACHPGPAILSATSGLRSAGEQAR
ncbi:O-antigen ligase family protein [Roseibium marinum]|uniref:O-antigen ligase-like membrane protein n=1 Tax=Roseibium marinum TaxID=281252 RepID=A0A2S3UMX6_9HYPH|nr:O-antigen ligase family protein [Roseibium marinum]POF28913.1 O-antigen ligase-like membrane protein [Roseibium marinum]